MGSSSGLMQQHAGLLSALFYAAVSMALTLFNKAVLSSYNFGFAKTITLSQCLMTLAFLFALKLSGKTQQFDKLSWRTARRVFPLALTYMAYVVVSLSSLRGVNVPMFTSLRRLGILFVLALEYYLLKKRPDGRVLQTVAVMVLGAVIAGASDFAFDLQAYSYVFVANLSTAMYVVFIKRVSVHTGLSSLNIMLYNNLITLPVLSLYTLASGEFSSVLEYPLLGDSSFQWCFLASTGLAFLLNYSLFLSSQYNSATTQTVLGQAKNFLTILLGMVFFADYKYHGVNLLGLFVGFLGSVAYAYVQFTAKKPAPASSSSSASNSKSLMSPSAKSANATGCSSKTRSSPLNSASGAPSGMSLISVRELPLLSPRSRRTAPSSSASNDNGPSRFSLDRSSEESGRHSPTSSMYPSQESAGILQPSGDSTMTLSDSADSASQTVDIHDDASDASSSASSSTDLSQSQQAVYPAGSVPLLSILHLGSNKAGFHQHASPTSSNSQPQSTPTSATPFVGHSTTVSHFQSEHTLHARHSIAAQHHWPHPLSTTSSKHHGSFFDSSGATVV